jgi:methyltransferase-like protein
VFHDDLGPFTDATYFRDFAEHARRHALQYLAEAELSEVTPDHVPPPMRQALARLVAGEADLLTREQHLDFLKGRSFRRTLLCHANVQLTRPPAPQRVGRLRAASPARPGTARPDVRSADVAESFHSPKGRHASTSQPLLKAALVTLCDAWPESIAFDDLLERAAAMSGAIADAEWLANALLSLCGGEIVELIAIAPPVARDPGERPRASPLARVQAEAGEMLVSAANGATVRLDGEPSRRLLALLDGTRTRADLTSALQGVTQPAQLDARLAQLARLALLHHP